jgi:hypothetical protein
MHCREFFWETAPEQAREHAHRQEEAGPACDPPLAVWRQDTTRDDAVHVRMVRQCRAPGMQNQRRANLRAQMLWIGGDGAQGLGGNIVQRPVDSVRGKRTGCIRAIRSGSWCVISKKNFSPVIAAFSDTGNVP